MCIQIQDFLSLFKIEWKVLLITLRVVALAFFDGFRSIFVAIN